MKNLMEKKSTKIIVFILLLALFDFNNIALFVIRLFIQVCLKILICGTAFS